MSLIELHDICKLYKGKGFEVRALTHINLSIDEGEMLAIMGPSGSGKSTLLNILGCIDDVTSGNYMLNQKDITCYTKQERALLRNKEFGFVLQDFALLDRYSVKYNIELPLRYAKKRRAEVNERVNELMHQFGIEDKEKMKPNMLSGGQRQRVAIARALVNEANIILSDEPTGALDSKMSQDIMNIFHDINRKGKTVIIVTHDPVVASQCKRIIHIVDGELKENNEV